MNHHHESSWIIMNHHHHQHHHHHRHHQIWYWNWALRNIKKTKSYKIIFNIITQTNSWAMFRGFDMSEMSFHCTGWWRWRYWADVVSYPRHPEVTPFPMAHRVTPGQPEVTPGTKSYWHTGTTSSLVWQTKYLKCVPVIDDEHPR